MDARTLASQLTLCRLAPGGPNPTITDITNDSRKVSPGALYAALPGLHVDGNDFIANAIDRGAVAILCAEPRALREPPAQRDPRIAWFVTEHPRMALSEASDAFFGYPSRQIEVIGVTGTDGKTSTVYFLYQLLTNLLGPTGFVSSAAQHIDDRESPNPEHQSTPEAPEVHRSLRRMVEGGMRYAIVESTSHGLSPRTARLAHVHYRAAVLTNMGHEHLEFHGTFEQYRHDKANLFRALDHGVYAAAERGERSPAAAEGDGSDARLQAPPFAVPFGVVNADDATRDYFRSACSAPFLEYSVTGSGDLRASDIRLSADGTSFLLETPVGGAPCRLPVPCLFNVSNVLAACSVVIGLSDVPVERLARAVGTLRPVRGRVNVVATDPFTVIVDFAHTPGSFEAVLPFFRDQTAGKLIVVFGSAGERDPGKRPLQGAVAHRYADVIVLADEDPRGEDPMDILNEIASGCPQRVVGRDLYLIPDRREAIRAAFAVASPRDTVLLLGKGHETSIIGSRGTIPWDELAVAGEELAKLRESLA